MGAVQDNHYRAHGVYGAAGRTAQPFMTGLSAVQLSNEIGQMVRTRSPRLSAYSGVDILTPQGTLLEQFIASEKDNGGVAWFHRYNVNGEWVQNLFCEHNKPETIVETRRVSSPEKERVDAYMDTVRRLEPSIAQIDKGYFYASVAISLKRIADSLDEIVARGRA